MAELIYEPTKMRVIEIIGYLLPTFFKLLIFHYGS